MIDEQEAENRAQALVKQLVNDAGCTNMRDVANVLTMLLGVTGLSIVQATSHNDAIRRMSSATAYVTNNPNGRHARPPEARIH